ncbi:MAG: hypothetical protein IJU76_02120 [Desulfovibrionaceae bacterium]|nr:hypothetical protein [Desulfovibrionaceae bacterium]
MKEAMQGCIVFDSPTKQNCGWFAVGEEAAKRFESQKNLERSYPECIWLTNISYEVKKACGMPKRLCCCTDDYLHASLNRLAARYKLSDSRLLAEFGAKLMHRTLSLARFLVGDPEFTPGRSLRHGLRKYAGVRDIVLSPEPARAMQEATFYNMNCLLPENDFPKSEEIGYFSCLQQNHCIDLLETCLPEGKLIEYRRDRLPTRESDRNAVGRFIRDHRMRPGLFHITWHSLDDTLVDILRFIRDGECLRHDLWLTNPDLELIQPWADILIHQAYFFESQRRIKDAKIFAHRLPVQSLLSLTCERIFINLWHGLATKQSPRRLRGDLIPVNPHSAYLHARDRQMIFQTVVDLKSSGLRVLGFSNGCIRVDLRDMDPEYLYQIARETDCLPPFLGLSAGACKKPDPKNMLACLQFAYATNALASLLKVDRKIVELVCSQQSDGV